MFHRERTTPHYKITNLCSLLYDQIVRVDQTRFDIPPINDRFIHHCLPDFVSPGEAAQTAAVWLVIDLFPLRIELRLQALELSATSEGDVLRYEIDRRGALGDVRGDRVPVGQLRGGVERITLCGGYKACRLQSVDLILGRCLPIQQAVHLILRPRLQRRELILRSPGCDIDTPHLTADLIGKDLELRTRLIDREIRFVRQVAVSHGARFDADIPTDHPLGHVEIRPAVGADDVADAHLPG